MPRGYPRGGKRTSGGKASARRRTAGRSQQIKHVFVLMLENRSFDHMLGFSKIQGTDAETGQVRPIHGATGNDCNIYKNQPYCAAQPADYAVPVDPRHEFEDVVEQLCGPDAVYTPGAPYPKVTGGGFVSSYMNDRGTDPRQVMRGYGEDQLPVLVALANEFAVCDNWHASMPGPTWPNRFFCHAASSGGLDHSPSIGEILWWELGGFRFKNGTIFDRLRGNKLRWRIYAGDEFPVVGSLEGIHPRDIRSYGKFARDVSTPQYPAAYTFIEPRYNVLADYKCGTSQHPLDDVTRGEALIKRTYEALRKSPLWEQSVLIVTWDEHGGFYDHDRPGKAVPPGDTKVGGPHNRFKFRFDQYGPRVPAVVVSPFIPRNMIDGRLYDHASIPAALEACFGLTAMTKRDASAGNPMELLSLPAPRTDTPEKLPAPARSGVTGCPPVDVSDSVRRASPVSRPADSIDEGNVPGILHAVLRADLALSPRGARAAVIGRFAAMRTRGEAWEYQERVRRMVRAARRSTSR